MNVRLGGRQADVEPAGDFLIAEPGADQLAYLLLAGGQRGDAAMLVMRPAIAGAKATQQAEHDVARTRLPTVIDCAEELDQISEPGGSRDKAVDAGLGP